MQNSNSRKRITDLWTVHIFATHSCCYVTCTRSRITLHTRRRVASRLTLFITYNQIDFSICMLIVLYKSGVSTVLTCSVLPITVKIGVFYSVWNKNFHICSQIFHSLFYCPVWLPFTQQSRLIVVTCRTQLCLANEILLSSLIFTAVRSLRRWPSDCSDSGNDSSVTIALKSTTAIYQLNK